MTEEKKSFTVNDRRHFTPQGAVREAEGTEGAPTPVPPAPEPARERERVAETPAESRGSRTAAPADLRGLIVSLATQASMLLSPPEGAHEGPDLEGARVLISWLDVLRTKTDGRRSPEEDRLLDDVLHELHLAFVATARSRA